METVLGGFTAPLQFSLGVFPSDIAVADFNNDNKLDLAVSISLQEPAPGPGKIKHYGAARRWQAAFLVLLPSSQPTEAHRALLRPILTAIPGRISSRPTEKVNNLTVAPNTCPGSPPPPPTSFTISGAVTNGSGQGIADVTMILESDVAEPQIVFTNQSGNYTFTYAANLSHNLKVTPSKSGFSFSPLAIVFTSSSSVSGDKTASFTGTPSPKRLRDRHQSY